MARPAQNPRAGAIGAIPLLALLCAAATSHAQTPPPASVINNQIQLGDVFATQTITVVEMNGGLNVVAGGNGSVTNDSDGVTATTTANGNAVLASAVGVNMAITSNQTMAGNTIATTTVNSTTGLGPSTQINTTAINNSADVSTTQATMTGVITQIATASPTVTAQGFLEAPTATAGNVGMTTTAASNSTSLGLTNGSAGIRVNQSSGADVLADGGATVQYVSGTAEVFGAAAGNNVTLVGTDTSAARIAVSQVNTGGLVQASQFTAYGNAQTASTSATASGNIIAAENQGPLLDVASNQYNEAYVRAQAEGSSYQFGAGYATAYGVGNSVSAGNSGEAVVLDSVQLNNGGGVEAIASFSGQEGYDAYSRATAVGNDATAYSCASCTGTMSVNSRQTNNADVGATSTTTVGTGRLVNSTSTAIGNNASFYVTRPGS